MHCSFIKGREAKWEPRKGGSGLHTDTESRGPTYGPYSDSLEKIQIRANHSIGSGPYGSLRAIDNTEQPARKQLGTVSTAGAQVQLASPHLGGRMFQDWSVGRLLAQWAAVET